MESSNQKNEAYFKEIKMKPLTMTFKYGSEQTVIKAKPMKNGCVIVKGKTKVNGKIKHILKKICNPEWKKTFQEI